MGMQEVLVLETDMAHQFEALADNATTEKQGDITTIGTEVDGRETLMSIYFGCADIW